MTEAVESEWIESQRYGKGSPVGYRTFKTDLGANMEIESVILAIEKQMEARNDQKRDGLDQGIFCREEINAVTPPGHTDEFWRYTVSMAFISAKSEVRKKCQTRLAEIVIN